MKTLRETTNLKVKLPSINLDNFIVLVIIIIVIVMPNAVLSTIIIMVKVHTIGNLQPSPISKTAVMNHSSLVLNINWLIKFIKLELNILISAANTLIVVTMIIVTSITKIIVKTKNLLIR